MPTVENQETQRRGSDPNDTMDVRAVELRRRREEQTGAQVENIKQARARLDLAVRGLEAACHELRSTARRNFDESSQNLLVFANSHIRLAGAVSQVVKRTASMDRVLDTVARDREDARQREAEFRRKQEAEAQVKEHGKLVQKLQLPTDDDFEELYGEILAHASE